MPDEELLNVAYRKTFKLALAASIIRSKPSHMSAREYAQHLAQQIKSGESSWKSKHETISTELLEAKQKIVLLQLKTNPTVHQALDTVGNGENDGDGGTPMVLTEDQKIVYGDFLSSIVSFKEWNRALQDDRRSIETIKESLCFSLRQFLACLDDVPLNDHNFILISKNLKAMAEVATKAMILDEVVILCCTNIIEKLIKVMMTSDGAQKLCENMSSLLVLLGQSCLKLRDFVLERLVNVISLYSKLVADTESFIDLDVATYEVMYFICDGVTQLFTSTRHRWPYEKHGFLMKQLNEGMLPISGRFPMLAHEMWIISIYLAESSSEGDEDLFSQSDPLGAEMP